MTTIRFRSPVTRPLHPPRIGPRIADEFYVTQRFGDPDFYWKDRDTAKYLAGHRATDIGNGQCGYPIVAMAPGRVIHVEDNATAFGAPNNALGVRIDHGHGVTTDVWHLDSRSVFNGELVAAGRQIGKLGKTGLGQVCHAHIEARINGVRINPEPLMFGGSITIGAAVPEEDDLLIPPGLKHIGQAKIAGGNLLRVSRETREGAKKLTKTEFVSFYGLSDDANAPYTLPKIGGGTIEDTRWALVGYGGRFWEAGWLLLFDVDLTATGKELLPQPAPEGFTAAQLHAAEDNAFIDGRDAAVIKVLAGVEAAKTITPKED